MSRITKKELLEALADYPDNAKINFWDGESYKVFDIAEILYHDDDFVPALCTEVLCPRISIELKKHI